MMAHLKLFLEGELRSVAVHAFDQLGAALRDASMGLHSVSDVSVQAHDTEATITMTISAARWQEASEIGSALIREAIARTGFTYLEYPDRQERDEKSVTNEGSRLTLI